LITSATEIVIFKCFSSSIPGRERELGDEWCQVEVADSVLLSDNTFAFDQYLRMIWMFLLKH
jgi:hypothetical protein